MCRYYGGLSDCTAVYSCSDVENRGSTDCANTVTIYGERCYHTGSICRYRDCADRYGYSNLDCYSWKRNCILVGGSSSYCQSTSCEGYWDIY